MAESRRHLKHPEFAQNPVVAEWREAYRKFKTKKGARSSIEALLKRVSNGNPVGTINPLVDLYNCISLKYGLPCGGEDLDAVAGSLRLTVAQGGESFLPLGAEAEEPALAGEVIYADDAGAVCRCFNWREAQRTMLTEKTTNAFLCIELVDGSRMEELKNALAELEELVLTRLGGAARQFILSDTETIDLSAD